LSGFQILDPEPSAFNARDASKNGRQTLSLIATVNSLKEAGNARMAANKA